MSKTTPKTPTAARRKQHVVLAALGVVVLGATLIPVVASAALDNGRYCITADGYGGEFQGSKGVCGPESVTPALPTPTVTPSVEPTAAPTVSPVVCTTELRTARRDAINAQLATVATTSPAVVAEVTEQLRAAGELVYTRDSTVYRIDRFVVNNLSATLKTPVDSIPCEGPVPTTLRYGFAVDTIGQELRNGNWVTSLDGDWFYAAPYLNGSASYGGIGYTDEVARAKAMKDAILEASPNAMQSQIGDRFDGTTVR